MAGLAWLTCRHRPSEPRLVCDLSLLHRLPIGADSGQIGSVWPLAQGSGSCSCCSCWLLLLLALVAPAAPAGAGGSCCRWRWWLLLLLFLLLLLLALLALVAPAAAGVPIGSPAHWQGDGCRSCPILGESQTDSTHAKPQPSRSVRSRCRSTPVGARQARRDPQSPPMGAVDPR